MTITLNLNSIGQVLVNYYADCREFRHIRKYTCIILSLKTDKTFHYEEIAGDLPLIIENGTYSWTGDTLQLRTKKSGVIRYLKKRNDLILQNKTNNQSLKGRLHLDKKERKPNTDNKGKLFVTLFALAKAGTQPPFIAGLLASIYRNHALVIYN